MGYLDNSSITVDAILTKRGRELLARNDGSFQITQFALGDDEVDYSLFNENHPNGTQYSAEAIENMPLIEAMPDGANSMNSKLITLARGASAIPYIVSSYPSTGIALSQGSSATLDPTTYNLADNNQANNEEYIFTILDNRLRETFTATGQTNATPVAAIQNFSNLATAESVQWFVLNIQATVSNALFSTTTTSRTTSIIVEGVSSGARLTIPLTVNSTTT